MQDAGARPTSAAALGDRPPATKAASPHPGDQALAIEQARGDAPAHHIEHEQEGRAADGQGGRCGDDIQAGTDDRESSRSPGRSPLVSSRITPWATCHDARVLGRSLFVLSAVVLAASGVAYLVAPGFALGIVDIQERPDSEFLLRTEGVALLFGAALVWLVRGGDGPARRNGLLALSGYYVFSSLVDLAALAEGIVGPASVPSAAIRVAVGAICLVAAWNSGRELGTRGISRPGPTGHAEEAATGG
jgi:hypothetical protein